MRSKCIRPVPATVRARRSECATGGQRRAMKPAHNERKIMRKMRKYRLWCEDGGSKDVEAPNLAAAVERLKRWVRGRDWGDEGARVWGEVTRLRGDRLIEDESATVTVEIEPDGSTTLTVDIIEPDQIAFMRPAAGNDARAKRKAKNEA